VEVDPEESLRATNAKFERRFAYIESKLEERGRALKDATLEEMDALWNEAKTHEKR
jgi:ATP diphosphatase